MRSKTMRGFLVGVLAVAALWWGQADAASADKEFSADKGAKTIDVSTFPKEEQKRYKVFVSRCSRCHTVARAINTDMAVSAWKRYVKRMMTVVPDSGISPAAGKQIYKFLKYYQKRKDEQRKKAAAAE